MLKAMIAALVAVCAIAGVTVSSASASGGTSIIENSFVPSTIQPGDSTTLTLTVEQSGEWQSPNAEVVIYNLDQAGLTFVSNGDSSANCYSEDYYGGFVVCEYSDFAHTYKSDSFNFTSDGSQPYGSYPVYEEVYTGENGYDSATSTIRYAPKPVVVTNSGAKLCYSVNGQHADDAGMYTTSNTDTAATLMASGYWAPTAVGFNADGTPTLSCETPLAGGVLNDPAANQYTDNNGDDLTPEEAVLGDYPVHLS